MSLILSLAPFYRWVHWDLGRLSSLFRVTCPEIMNQQLVFVSIQVSCFQWAWSEHPSLLAATEPGVLHVGLQAAALTLKSTPIHLNQATSEVLPVVWRDFVSNLGLFFKGISPKLSPEGYDGSSVPVFPKPRQKSQMPTSLSLTLLYFAIGLSGFSKKTIRVEGKCVCSLEH